MALPSSPLSWLEWPGEGLEWKHTRDEQNGWRTRAIPEWDAKRPSQPQSSGPLALVEYSIHQTSTCRISLGKSVSQPILATQNSVLCMRAKSLQSCPSLCDPMDCSPPGSSVHGILQARILEWVAMPSSRGSFQPRDQTQVSCVSCLDRWVLYHEHHLGSTPPQSPRILSQADVIRPQEPKQK